MTWLIVRYVCHTITRCSTLEHAGTHCNTLQHVYTKMGRDDMVDDVVRVSHCNMLQNAAKRCNTLQHAATSCNTFTQRQTTTV